MRRLFQTGLRSPSRGTSRSDEAREGSSRCFVRGCNLVSCHSNTAWLQLAHRTGVKLPWSTGPTEACLRRCEEITLTATAPLPWCGLLLPKTCGQLGKTRFYGACQTIPTARRNAPCKLAAKTLLGRSPVLPIPQKKFYQISPFIYKEVCLLTDKFLSRRQHGKSSPFIRPNRPSMSYTSPVAPCQMPCYMLFTVCCYSFIMMLGSVTDLRMSCRKLRSLTMIILQPCLHHLGLPSDPWSAHGMGLHRLDVCAADIPWEWKKPQTGQASLKSMVTFDA
jgi:hypothetical protein